MFVEGDDAGQGPAVLAGPLASCVRRGQQTLSPELREALSTIAYESFAEDGCRASFALALRDPSLCEPVQLPQLRRSCLLRVAIARGERALCPRATDEPGPDPLCVALATRIFSACPSAGRNFAHWCRAIAERDPERCRALPGPLRTRCVADVNALGGTFAHAARPQPTAGSMRLEIEWLDGREPPRTIEADGMERGAYATESRDIVLVDPRRRWPSTTAYAVDGARAVVGFELTLGEQRRGEVRSMRVVLPDGRAIEALEGRAAGVVEYTHASRTPGHELSGTITAQGAHAGRAVRVRATFSTFIRDVVSAREARDGQRMTSASDAGTDE